MRPTMLQKNKVLPEAGERVGGSGEATEDSEVTLPPTHAASKPFP